MRFGVLLVAFSSLSFAHLVAIEAQAGSVKERVAEIVRAHQAGDGDEMRALARDAKYCRMRVLKSLFAQYLRDALADPPKGRGRIDAALAYAKEADALAGYRGILELVTTYAGYSRAELERERRLINVLVQVTRARAAKRYAQAIRLARDARVDLDGAGERSIYGANILHHIGMIEYKRGRWPQAIAALKRAASAFERIHYRDSLAKCECQAGRAHRWQSDPEAAMACFSRARALWSTIGEPHTDRAAVLADLERSEILEQRGEWEAAVACVRAGLASAIARGDHALAANARGLLGAYLTRRMRYTEAVEELTGTLADAKAQRRRVHPRVRIHLSIAYSNLGLLERARACLDREPAPGWEPWLNALAIWHHSRGDYASAIDTLERALAVLGDTETAQMNRGVVLLNLGRFWMEVGNADRAIESLERAQDELEASGAVALLADLEIRIARFYGSRGEPARAVTYAAQAVSRSGHPMHRIELQQWRVSNAIRLRDFADARRHLAGLRAGAPEWNRLWIRVQEAWILALEGDDDAAIEKTAEAVADTQRAAVPGYEAYLRRQLAALQWRAGRFRESVASARAASLVESVDLPGLGARINELHHGVSDPVREIGLLSATAVQREDASALEDVMWFVESSRARRFATGLVNRRRLLDAHAPEALVMAFESARAEVGRRRKAYLAGEDDGRERLSGATLRVSEALGKIQRVHRGTARLTAPALTTVSGLRAALEDDEAFVSFRFVEAALDHTAAGGDGSAGRVVAVAVTKRGECVAELDVPPAALTKSIRAWQALLTTPGAPDEKPARALYRRLFGSMTQLFAGKRRLYVSPDGVMNFLPFDALVCDDAGTRLIERHEIVLVPSATVHTALRADAAGTGAGRGLLAVADPIYRKEVAPERAFALRGPGSLPRLPETAVEVDAVRAFFDEESRTILTRKNASVEQLRRALGEKPARLAAIHFACHGHIGDRGDNTGLVLNGGEMLTLNDLYCMRIPADLAVLSACSTARGRLTRYDGVVGLVRGFFFAGCPRVVVSNWAVRDRVAREIMTAFYRKMHEQGLRPAAALRAAKREAHEAGAHPSKWAAFVLWGLR